jgi:hypothetical protein
MSREIMMAAAERMLDENETVLTDIVQASCVEVFGDEKLSKGFFFKIGSVASSMVLAILSSLSIPLCFQLERVELEKTSMCARYVKIVDRQQKELKKLELENINMRAEIIKIQRQANSARSWMLLTMHFTTMMYNTKVNQMLKKSANQSKLLMDWKTYSEANASSLHDQYNELIDEIEEERKIS